jgi:hypothetical protein
MKWEYRILQFRTRPTIGIWSRLSNEDLQTLEQLLNSGWEVHEMVNVRGSMGFTAHVVFILRRPVQ